MAALDHSKVCRDCGMCKPLVCFTKKERGVLGVRAECNQCRAINRRARYAQDEVYRRSILDAQKARNAANPIPNRQKAHAWARANPERVREAKQRARQASPELYDKPKREWAKRNKHLVNAATARRAAAKRNATVAWANRFFIEEAYELARRRTAVLGVIWHVDHIVPLRSPFVCGLHVESNLQVLPAKANKLKSNLWWPDMWESA